MRRTRRSFSGFARAVTLTVLGLAAGSAALQAQTGSDADEETVIRGRVVDNTGAPVPTALVGIALSNRAVMADSAGRFALPVGPAGTVPDCSGTAGVQPDGRCWSRRRMWTGH